MRSGCTLCTGRSSSASACAQLCSPMVTLLYQAKFRLVYGAKTFSNNNNWLRRKLFEAIGVDPAKVRSWAGGMSAAPSACGRDGIGVRSA